MSKTVSFSKIDWFKEDWIDFYHTLEAFKERVAKRHGVILTPERGRRGAQNRKGLEAETTPGVVATAGG